MFCPNCAANNSTEQKFCRACGLNLEDAAKSLLLQIPSAESAELLKHEQWLEKFGAVAWYGFGIVVLIGIGAILYAIVTSMILSGRNVWVGILLTAFIIFAALAEIYVFYAQALKEEKEKYRLRSKNELNEPRDTAKLLEEKPFEPIPSVTENTTGLLYAEQKTKKFE